ncbi:DUF1127 domain-containing protein [Billgrantia tianxiuensis]|jgi:uncharacterized protein YjiS (DUF1127 family)|uniref:DUF1127 domain-containing protein n=1 Tax=Billgrantia tianxiuensis TaxID=2497861 RepID=A0A6I6SQQ5_9GAMM|nr:MULTISPECIES: DUF1127 domain-containing protein [Halomonas]MCE8034229.1 DUF1127 domain-containing protein [Halomonas sp. MCCC 1A11057]QHC50956.1 DUF1127 domain-containing protein [Halomonas tianxiuensis]
MRAASCNDSCCAVTGNERESHAYFSLLGTGLARVRHLMQLRRERSQLQTLPDELLRDVGLTREQAQRESRRHFWDDIGWRR